MNHGDPAPLPGARIDFYRQGATVRSSPPVTIAPSHTGTVNVLGLGSLLSGNSVEVGFPGPTLSVTSVDPVTNQVVLSNATGASVTINPGDRLVNLTAPPTLYADEQGLAEMGSSITADSGGRATAFLPSGTYDYLITGVQPVTVDTYTTEPFHDADDTTTWNHTCNGTSRMLLVHVAWQASLDPETLDSITYAGTPMQSVYSNSLVSVYALVDPPAGTHPVVVSWSDTGGKGAACGSVSLTNALQRSTLRQTYTAAGPGGTATVSVLDTRLGGLVLAFLGVNTAPGATTTTLSGAFSTLWDFDAGLTTDNTRTRAFGVFAPSSGSHVDPTWTVSPSTRDWELAGIEVLPAGMSIHADETGEECACTGFGLNACDYATLQDAIDALPATGGVLYVPAGTYRLTTGLTITKPNVTLIGEGASTIIAPEDPADIPIDLLTIRAPNTRIYRMKFDGLASEQDLDTGTCGIVFQGYDGPLMAPRLVQHCYLENVIVTGASKFGIWLLDTIVLTAINCEFVLNKGTGLRIQGTDPHGSCNALRFIGCGISNNGGLGVDIGDPVVPPDTIGTGQVGETFLGCTMELNQGNGYTLANVGISLNAQSGYKLEVLSCYFEAPAAGAKQFLRFENCPNVTVDNCNFSGNPGAPTSGPDRAVSFVNCSWARATSNVAQGFKTEIIKFDDGCAAGVEFANRDFDATTETPRVTIAAGATAVTMSQPALGLPTYQNDLARPVASHIRAGAMIWVIAPTAPNTNLQVSNGASWVSF